MFRYVPIQESLNTAELGEYRSYGIGALNERHEVVTFVSDVSTDPKTVAQIAALCTVGQLDPGQLKDVVLNTI